MASFFFVRYISNTTYFNSIFQAKFIEIQSIFCVKGSILFKWKIKSWSFFNFQYPRRVFEIKINTSLIS